MKRRWFVALLLICFTNPSCRKEGPSLSPLSPHYLPIQFLLNSFFHDWHNDDHQGMMKRIDFGDQPIGADEFRRAFLIKVPGREDVYLSPDQCKIDDIIDLNYTGNDGNTASGCTVSPATPATEPGNTLHFDIYYSCTFDFHENLGDLDQALLYPEQHCQLLRQMIAATEDPNSENLSLVFLNLAILQIRANSEDNPGLLKLYLDPNDFPDKFKVSVPEPSWYFWIAMAPNNASKWNFDWNLRVEKGPKGYRINSPFSETKTDEDMEILKRVILDNYRYALRSCPP